MLAGTWGHKALAVWPNKGWEEVLKPYETLSAELGIVDDRRGYANLRTLIQAFAVKNPVGRLPFTFLEPDRSEVSFVAPLGEVEEKDGNIVPIDLIGYIDKLVRDKHTGRIIPLEHKFPGKLDEALASKFADYDIQTTGYIFAAKTVLGEPCYEAYVNAIEVKDVPSSSRMCPKHGVPYSECGSLGDIRDAHCRSSLIPVRRDDSDLAEFVALALSICKTEILPVARALQKRGPEVALKTPRNGAFTAACEYCDYRRWCRVTKRSRTGFDKMLRDSIINDTRLRSGLVYAND